MGYTTDFRGEFRLNKTLDEDTHRLLIGISETRRMKRKIEGYGVEGEFYLGKGEFGQEHDETIVDYNTPPSTQPSLWCRWMPSKDGNAIVWNETEKFYGYVAWIRYLIDAVLAPRGYVLNGDMHWRGEDFDDVGMISIRHNAIMITMPDTAPLNNRARGVG